MPGLLVATGWLLLALGCSRKESASAKVDDSPAAAAQESVARAAADFPASLPHIGGPAGYVGSETCRSCHEDQFESWHRSYHRTMTQVAAPDTIQADFRNVALTNEGVRFVLSQTNNEFWVRMERLASAAQGEAPPLSPQDGERAGRGAAEERFMVREHGPREQPAAHEPPLTPSLSPSEGERVAEGRVRRRFIEPMNAQQPKEETREALDVRVGLVTGSHHMQVFWVPGGEGNMQIGFPFTWLIPEKRWVPRNSTFVRPPDVPHRSEVWNVVCSRCHATGIEPRVDTERRTMDTRAGELGIACEACHGPGQNHVNARQAESKSTTPAAQTLRSEIIHPKKVEPVRASQICGFCHSMKWWDRNEGWPERGFRYRPGDDLEATTPIIRPSRVKAVSGLADYLDRNPDLLRDFFWPDGMVRVSGRDYNGLLESPCYKGGKFSCLSCHSLHESDPDSQLARDRTGNGACTQCHERFREEASLTAHTRHQAGSSGSLCYNCHMPHTTYGVLKAIRSHQVSSPRVADQLATGRPNACNLCHLDKPLAWAANQLGRWYGHSIPDLSEDQTAVADAVR
ncbi:MAG TPA: cytochrome c3 family protein, partial [Verrucomicrobiae bacterium]|nr:cytochrome c3 family protein [Verrucomicrobiae bacterium]